MGEWDRGKERRRGKGMGKERAKGKERRREVKRRREWRGGNGQVVSRRGYVYRID